VVQGKEHGIVCSSNVVADDLFVDDDGINVTSHRERQVLEKITSF
jgi:hypothetical protein